MEKFPQLETDRLILGQLEWTDIPKIVKYAGNKEIADKTLNIPHPYHEKDAIFWINSSMQGLKNGTQYTFGIRIKSKKKFIGGIGLKVNLRFNRAELGYWIAESFWDKGYATEATKEILRFGFEELELNKIHATHLVENPASGKVMIKNGMIKEAELKEHIKKGNLYHTLIQYRLTKSEYEMKIAQNNS